MNKIIYISAFALLMGISACDATKKDNSVQEIEESESLTVTTSGVPIVLTTEEFKLKVANYTTTPNEWKYLGDKPCIIDFWATWCPPCKAIAPILEELATEYKDQIYIYKVDVDKEKELAGIFGIRSIPTLLFVPMSGSPQSEVGAIPKEKFKEKIDNFLLSDM